MHENTVDDQHQMGGDEAEEHRQQETDGFLEAAQVEHDQHADKEGLGPQFVILEAQRQERRQRVDAGGD